MMAWLLTRPKRALAVRAAILFVAGVFFDIITGLQISVFAFYFAPIFVGAFLISVEAGLIFSLLSGLVRLVAHFSLFQSLDVGPPLWNFAVDLTSFLIFTFLLASVREQLDNENNLARRDPLTGAANLRALNEALEIELKRVRRFKLPFTLIYLDLDNFKSVNDQCGHETGDELLRAVAATMKRGLRDRLDVVARIGGDEFVALLPQTPENGARFAAERLQKELLAEMQRRECGVTFSIGATTFEDAPASHEEALRQGDAAMYQAKNGGKNRVAYATGSDSPQPVL